MRDAAVVLLYVSMFGMFLAAGGFVAERFEERHARKVRAATRRHPSTGGEFR